ncbi:hypothetical protein T4D_6805 [Trichinella pseudospiralis]|uniref:Uncharacterized protein n=1 Tax=Trichinella pseudospiralis TaxID=6337 RepID=A0A0V1F2K6_TRIPS|nr:hypothetical protein T4D_6805 [Trichinella pseudospiralis]
MVKDGTTIGRSNLVNPSIRKYWYGLSWAAIHSSSNVSESSNKIVLIYCRL